MNDSQNEIVICIYRVREGREDELLSLLGQHWPAIHRLGLTTDQPAQVFLGDDGTDKPIVFEMFTWKDAEAPQRAHEIEEVQSMWKAIGELVEERDGRPAWEFPHVQPVSMAFA